MKKLILFTLSTVLTWNVNAQGDNTSAAEKAEIRAGNLKTELGLSDEQHKNVRTAVLEKINSANEVRERYKDSANKKGMRAELNQVNLHFRATMDVILNAEQRAKYKASEDEEGDGNLSENKSDAKDEKDRVKSDKKQSRIDKKQAKLERQQAKVKRKKAKVKDREERLKTKEEQLNEKKEKLKKKEEKLEKKEKKLEQKKEKLNK